MPRPPRLHVPGGCYHVTLRGNHREALFGTSDDRVKLNEIVADAALRCDARLHAFCWMTNHLHALVQIDERPVGNFVGNVASRYARYRHKALETTGHLFERRHGSRLVAANSYFLAVLRYIHLNPVKARIVADPGAYPWTSHRAYLGAETIGWVTTELGLSLLGQDPRRARAAYAELLGSPLELEGDELDLDDKAHPDDRRIIGDDDFVASVRAPARPKELDETPTLDELAESICASWGVSIALLRSRSSRRDLTPIRLALLEQALACRVASLSGVARYLGRDPSTLSRQWAKARRQQAREREKSKDPTTGT